MEKNTHVMKSTLLLVIVALMVSMFPTTNVQAAPEPLKVLEGYAYYGFTEDYPVYGDGVFRASSTEEVLTVDDIPSDADGYLQFTSTVLEDGDVYTVVAQQELMGFTLMDTDTVTATGEVTLFSDLHLTHTWAMYSPIPAGGVYRYGEGPVSVEPWDNHVTIEDAPGIYGCMEPREAGVHGAFFRMGFANVDLVELDLDANDFKVVRWSDTLGKYEYVPTLNSGTFVTDEYIEVLSGISGRSCFAIGGANLNTIPVAVANADKTNVEQDETITFDGYDSVDFSDATGGDGTIISYAWNFGDGETGSGIEVVHSYDDAGTYVVNLTVTDNNGAQDTDCLTITVDEKEEEDDEPTILLTLEQLLSDTGMFCLLIIIVGLGLLAWRVYNDRN